MADNNIIEREYTIPLRRHILKVPAYRRSRKAIKTIKIFIAKHMKVAERDVDKVKLDVYFNNEVWLRGKTNPPSQVRVKATKEGEIVKVTFVQMPERVKFAMAKNERLHRGASKEEVAPAKVDTKTADEKVAEKEKEAAVAESAQKEAKSDAKAKKHTTKVEKPMTKQENMPKKQ